MTFSNPLEKTLRKCHRVLANSLLTYRQNCVVAMPDLEKLVDLVPVNMILVKSKRIFFKETDTQI